MRLDPGVVIAVPVAAGYVALAVDLYGGQSATADDADTGDDLVLSANGSDYVMSLYAKSYASGATVTVGGNEYGGPTYNVVVEAGVAAPAPVKPAVRSRSCSSAWPSTPRPIPTSSRAATAPARSARRPRA